MEEDKTIVLIPSSSMFNLLSSILVFRPFVLQSGHGTEASQGCAGAGGWGGAAVPAFAGECGGEDCLAAGDRGGGGGVSVLEGVAGAGGGARGGDGRRDESGRADSDRDLEPAEVFGARGGGAAPTRPGDDRADHPGVGVRLGGDPGSSAGGAGGGAASASAQRAVAARGQRADGEQRAVRVPLAGGPRGGGRASAALCRARGFILQPGAGGGGFQIRAVRLHGRQRSPLVRRQGEQPAAADRGRCAGADHAGDGGA